MLLKSSSYSKSFKWKRFSSPLNHDALFGKSSFFLDLMIYQTPLSQRVVWGLQSRILLWHFVMKIRIFVTTYRINTNRVLLYGTLQWSKDTMKSVPLIGTEMSDLVRSWQAGINTYAKYCGIEGASIHVLLSCKFCQRIGKYRPGCWEYANIPEQFYRSLFCKLILFLNRKILYSFARSFRECLCRGQSTCSKSVSPGTTDWTRTLILADPCLDTPTTPQWRHRNANK